MIVKRKYIKNCESPLKLCLEEIANFKIPILKKKKKRGTSMAVQWLRPHAFTAEDMNWSPGRGTKTR